MTNPRHTLSQGHAEAAANPEERRLASIASGWTPDKQAEHAQLQRLSDSGARMSPTATMRLGYLDQAKAAYDQTHGE